MNVKYGLDRYTAVASARDPWVAVTAPGGERAGA